MNTCQHWSQVEYLHLTVTNPNICLKGQHSYYSGAWDGPFEEVAVRYLHGDPFSRSPETGWEPLWHIDRLHIGDYVQIAAGVKIIMGGQPHPQHCLHQHLSVRRSGGAQAQLPPRR